MFTLTIGRIEPATDPQNASVTFSEYFYNSQSCYGHGGGDTFSYPTARRLIKALGYKEEARALKSKVMDLAPRIQEIQTEQETLRSHIESTKKQLKELQSIKATMKGLDDDCVQKVETLLGNMLIPQDIPQEVKALLQSSREIFKNEQQKLKDLVAEYVSDEKRQAKEKELRSLMDADYIRLEQINKEILPPELKEIKMTFPEESCLSDRNPCYQYLCELTAREKGQVYTTPTSEEFLRHAAKSLAKFEEPYKREEFLITTKDLQRLYEENTGMEVGSYCGPRIDYDRIKNVQDDLVNYIAEEADAEVTMTILSRQAAQKMSNVHISNNPFNSYFQLQIGDQTRILEYSFTTDPFKFL